ncbi:MAG: AAA family ATPase [Promethearchaeota archaeon]
MGNNSNFLIILVGLPASGKSTLAFKLKKILESNFQKKVKIIDPDILRKETFTTSFDFRNEPEIREKKLQSVKRALIEGYIVISDDLNYYSSMRHDLKSIADSLSIKFYIIHILTPLKLCLKRNTERGKPIPNKIIKKVYHKFDNFNKYKWDTPFETYNIKQNKNLNQFIENLSNKIALDLKEKKRSKDLIKTKTSIREELDLITRKFVSELLKDPKYYNSKNTILEYRKSFIKSRSDEELDLNKISEEFKIYLDKKLLAKNLSFNNS